MLSVLSFAVTLTITKESMKILGSFKRKRKTGFFVEEKIGWQRKLWFNRAEPSHKFTPDTAGFCDKTMFQQIHLICLRSPGAEKETLD